jgi:alkyl hydroperoxide reductase subunit AhpC
MQQIVDLHEYMEFQALDVAFISIAFDPAEVQLSGMQQAGIEGVPMAVDEGGVVSEAYGVLRWAVATGEPGHTFVLVDESGEVDWIGDYGAPENAGVMYVTPAELVGEIRAHLD